MDSNLICRRSSFHSAVSALGGIEALLDALGAIKPPVQVLAMCGKNEELKAKLELETPTRRGACVVPVGYTRDMDEYMSASDLIVGKPGGLTTCEALAKGLVFVIANPIPGQEERNSDHLLERGCAIRSNNPATLGYKIEQLINDPKRLAAMRTNALKFARPDAAFNIADTLTRLGN